MEDNKFGIATIAAAIVLFVCSLLLFNIIVQEEHVDKACLAIENGNSALAISEIEQIRNIDCVGSNKQTVLMAACKTGNKELIQYIVNRGADVNKSPRGHLTPLELFCAYGYEAGEDALWILLDAGVKQSSYTAQPAIFHLAENFYWMDNNQKKIATEEAILLLQKGAPLRHKDNSLLHVAARSDMDDLFYTMVHSTEGLQLMSMRNSDGLTPWDVAVKNGATKVQKVIRDLEDEYRDDQGDLPNDEPLPSGPNVDLPDDFIDVTTPDDSQNEHNSPIDIFE